MKLWDGEEEEDKVGGMKPQAPKPPKPQPVEKEEENKKGEKMK